MGQIAALSYCVSTSAWIEFGREPELAKLDRRIRKILAINRSAGTPLFLSISLVQASLVRILLERDSAGDHERAREMLAAALETYAGIAMPRHCDLARGLLAQARAIVPNILRPTQRSNPAAFLQDYGRGFRYKAISPGFAQFFALSV